MVYTEYDLTTEPFTSNSIVEVIPGEDNIIEFSVSELTAKPLTPFKFDLKHSSGIDLPNPFAKELDPESYLQPKKKYRDDYNT